MKKKTTGTQMRIIHRYLGFFLAGIMAMYSLSGTLLIFRSTDFLKQEKHIETTLEPNLTEENLGKELKIKGFKVSSQENDALNFKDGTYNIKTGEVSYIKKDLPFILGKMTKLHKATTNDPLYWLNIFFGASLLFFVISTFWMFRPATKTFKKGLYFTLGGLLLTFLLLFV
ncbi:hypothetical protein [Arcticibacterium luteifluviistationis]|uniref:PepSY domain-containing protein n=1 Tax=Arcticibacterium luteifluviistationis TaxID=1784714 RepID=A0A2Z4GA49_9BACT|nr:hypothetical protein [Arcticibacterium luteifluviistationis]AWV98077.1 hypothetical protein DJ013_07780 [Arcticibacterium luteifluviistationis]